MRVFLSWSGERSRAVGTALRDWLPLILHYVRPWLSSADIEAGQRWATEVGKQLNDSSFGILCLTRDNLQSPWILFEAGALAKSVASGAVIPYLLDLEFSDVTGPLAQFQAKKAEEFPTLELIKAINSRATDPVPSDRIKELFDLAWPRLRQTLSLVPPHTASTQPVRPQREVLEELVQVVRAVEQRTRVLEMVATETYAVRTPLIEAIIGKAVGPWLKAAKAELYKGNKIEAIKRVREASGLGLRESKELVDSSDALLLQLRAISKSSKVDAIKAMREATDLGLLECKNIVDSWAASASE